MSFRNIVKDVRDGIGSLSRRGFEIRLPGLKEHHKKKSQDFLHEQHDHLTSNDQSRWTSLPPELLRDVIKRLETSESTWPSRKYVVACAAVCRSWRDICREIVKNPEFSGKLTFPISLKQVGPRDGTIQCFIKRDKSKSTYHLYLCLSSSVLVESGKFLLAARRYRKTTCTEYVISMDANRISSSSNAYIGKLRSNFIGTKFLVYDTQPPDNGVTLCRPGRTSRRFYSKKISPKVPTGSYNVAEVTYELNVLGTRGPRRMHCIMYSIPASALEPGGMVPGQPETFVSHSLGDSFRTMSFSKSSNIDHSTDFSGSHYLNFAGESSRFSDIGEGSSRFVGVTGESSRFFDSSRGNYFSDVTGGIRLEDEENNPKERPLVLQNKPPRWHEQLQCWCLNFRGRVTVASVKNFQLIAATQPSAGAPTPSQPAPSEHDKVILQFGKVGRDMFTMDYRYPLSAFQAFAICLTSFDTKLACE